MKRNWKTGLLLAAAVLTLWILWSNTVLEVNEYTVTSYHLPDAFDGFRIAHVSDLHNAEFGDNNTLLLGLLRQSRPDIIVITGDLVDSRHTNLEIALRFAEEAAEIAPCYYVSGNHESRISEYPALKSGLKAVGVTVLENERLALERNGKTITLIGVDDPSFRTDYLFGDSAAVMADVLQDLVAEDSYTILLSHRPELFDTYAKSGVDLVFSGHAHGGQFRLPFLGGLVAPNQGPFPEYDAGLYTEGRTNMLVSRGIGNSIIPIRINNRPEILVVSLHSEH